MFFVQCQVLISEISINSWAIFPTHSISRCTKRWSPLRPQDDNGRKRFFERCLDHQPAPPRRTLLMSCHEAQQAKITWRRVNQQAMGWFSGDGGWVLDGFGGMGGWGRWCGWCWMLEIFKMKWGQLRKRWCKWVQSLWSSYDDSDDVFSLKPFIYICAHRKHHPRWAGQLVFPCWSHILKRFETYWNML